MQREPDDEKTRQKFADTVFLSWNIEENSGKIRIESSVIQLHTYIT